MNQYNTSYIKLSSSENLESGIKNDIEVISEISSNVAGNST